MIKRLLLSAVAIVAMAFGAGAAELDMMPSFGGGGWESSYDAATKTITFDGDWKGRGWWYGDPGENFSAYDEMVIEFEAAKATVQLVVEYVDKSIESSSANVEAGKTKITLPLDEKGKSAVNQIYVQMATAGTLVMKAAYMTNSVPFDPTATVVLMDTPFELKNWNNFKIAASELAAMKLTAGDKLCFDYTSTGGSYKIVNPIDGWPVFPFMEAQEGFNATYSTLYLAEGTGKMSFALPAADVELMLKNGIIFQGDGLTVNKVYVERAAAASEKSNWYVSGQFNNWNNGGSADFAMPTTATDGVFEFQVAEISGEFLIVWAETPGTPDWSKKLGGVQNMEAGKAYTYTVGGDNFSVKGILKNVTIVLDTNAQTITLQGAAEENDYTDIYLVGDFGEGWSEDITTKPLVLKGDDTYEGTYELTAEKSYFKLKAGKFVYGTGAGDVEVAPGTEYPTAQTGSAFVLPAGTYTFVYVMAKNAEAGKLTVKQSDGIADIAADDNAPVEYFNLQGVRVANPAEGGVYIRRQGSKVSKILVK